MRAPGQIFTPSVLAERMWALAREALGHVDGPIRVVEPAAGDGALARAALGDGGPADVTAVELDPVLLGALRTTSARVVHADALTLARGDAPPSALGERFGALSPSEVPPELRAQGWADVVLANPPYLRETGNRAIFESLRCWKDGAWRSLYRKDADLHHFFWDVARRWLRPDGVLVFLTPAYFLESEAAQPLRDMLLEEGHVVGIWRAGTASVFPNASVEAAVTVWRKGGGGPTRRLDEDLELGVGLPMVELQPSSPWWLVDDPELAELGRVRRRLGDLYRVVEGVSTGANRLRSTDEARIEGASTGDGIFVLSDDERHELGDEWRVRRRLRGEGRPSEWVVMVRDRDLPRLDAGEPPSTPLERHLMKFRPVLERRAEIRRNPRRSWYALAWPRPELNAAGAIVTPKWAAAPCFEAASSTVVPMTDYRVLIPKDESAAGMIDGVLAWLNGPSMRPWFEHRMKRKGRMIEFYGRCLLEVPIPEDVVAG